MLYGFKTLVLFYKTFLTAYDYTRIGTIDDIEGYTSTLGTKNAVIEFELN
jgi:hypothetical protein